MHKYVLSRFSPPDGDRYDLVEVLRGARLFDPEYANGLDEAAAIGLMKKLERVPYLGKRPALLGHLRTELESYKRDCRDVEPLPIPGGKTRAPDRDFLTWHWERKKERPAFFEVVSVLVLIQPSSAGAERVFSLLVAYFGQRAAHTLADKIRASLMAAVNDTKC